MCRYVEGKHRTCTEQLIKRQLKAKRPRKLKKDGSPRAQGGAASTPSQDIPSSSVTKRRRSAAKAPAASAVEAAAAAVTTDAPALRENTAAVTDADPVRPVDADSDT